MPLRERRVKSSCTQSRVLHDVLHAGDLAGLDTFRFEFHKLGNRTTDQKDLIDTLEGPAHGFLISKVRDHGLRSRWPLGGITFGAIKGLRRHTRLQNFVENLASHLS